MQTINVHATDLRASLSAVLSAVEFPSHRVVIYRSGRQVGAFINAAEFNRLRSLPEEPPPLTPREIHRLRSDAYSELCARRTIRDAAQRTLEECRGGKDPLALANADLAVQEAEEAFEQAQKEFGRYALA